jgi:cleavage and polyadenylation specificity factor subunit 2
MFTFTPLLGAQSSSHASQSLLELDGGVKVLVDVGWDENFDTRQLAEIKKHASTLSFILLTHATTSHLGAYVHCCKHIPIFIQIPVYATSPVIAFGRTLLQDLYASTPLAATFIPSSASPEDAASPSDAARSNILRQAPTPEEVTKYFSLITPLKYSQPHQPLASSFSAPLEGLTLTAYNSGHTLGGTIWHIQHGMESIVYAVDWSQARENVIAGASWFGGVGGGEVIEQLRNPTALVCSSTGADRPALPGGRKARDDTLLAHIRTSLAKGGAVLIPSDSSARILELAWVMERTWQEGSNDPLLKNAKVYMASKSAHATLRHARSLLEWMDDSIVREFEGEDENTTQTHRRAGNRQVNGQASKPSRPFQFKHVKVVEKKAQLERILKGEGPRVVLASDLSLEWGFSQIALEEIAQNPENLVILTENKGSNPITNNEAADPAASQSVRPHPDETLWEWYTRRSDGVALEKGPSGEQLEQVHTGGRSLSVREVLKVALDPAETQVYQQYVATQHQMQSALASRDTAAEGDVDDAIDDDSSSSSSEDSDDEHQGRALNVSAALGGNRNKVALKDEDLGVSILLRKKGVYDFDVRHKKGRNAVFPYTHSRKRGDEFGDYIRPEDFLRAEEKEEQTGQDDDRSGPALGQKRKWGDTNDARNGRANKRQQTSQGQSALANVAEVPGDSSESESEEEAEPETDAFHGPAKVVFNNRTITFNARLAFVDFTGLHDQRSLQMLIPLIGPKRLILTSGTKGEVDFLAEDCRTLLKGSGSDAEEDSTHILTPVIGQTVDASVDTNAWIVRLSRNLVKRLHWQNVRNMGVVTLTGQLKGEEAHSKIEEDVRAKKQKLLKSEQPQDALPHAESTESIGPVLDMMPSNISASTRSVAMPIYVGDLRLADLRRLMSVAGHSAEFRGQGCLLIDGVIAVRKLTTSKIVVEGIPVNAVAAVTATRQPDSFNQVKRKIYEGLAVVASG